MKAYHLPYKDLYMVYSIFISNSKTWGGGLGGKCSLRGECMNKLVYPTGYYLVRKRNYVLTHIKWMNLKIIKHVL